MRKLIYIPIFHTTADMGSQAEALERAHVQRQGRGEWARTRRLIDEVWEGLRSRLLALDLDYRTLRIYQDGLPVCGRELNIVREVAQGGSWNYALVLELLERGAVVEGTESPDLLRQEYEGIRSVLAKEPAPTRTGELRASESERLLRERDEFIGRRIGESLKAGETGILFIGLMHHVDRFLPPDIEVQYLIHRLPFHISPGGAGRRRGHGR